MTAEKDRFIVPLIYIGAMYFTVGFTLGINSYLVPLLQSAMRMPAGASYLILAANFTAFLVLSYPASLIIRRIGYKRTMSFSFLCYAVGFLCFISSAYARSFEMFILASFICGTANAILQSAINPYVTILGPINSAARRMSIMGICNATAWAVAPNILSIIIGKSINQAVLTDITLPFSIIIIVSLVLALVMYKAPLEEIKAVGEGEDNAIDCPYAQGKTSIWQFPHLILGATTLFLYVGVETVADATTVDYAQSIGLADAAHYAVFPSLGMIAGYIMGIIAIPKYISQCNALRVCSIVAIIGTLMVIIAPPRLSVCFVGFISLGCSLMYPSIWPLAMVDLGRFTKTGSALLVTSIVGGAFIPTAFGYLKDAFGNQNAYWICLPCFFAVLFYALSGYRIRVNSKMT